MLFNCVMLEKTFESPLYCNEIQPVHPKGNQSWIFIGRTIAESETPILWPPDAKYWLLWKTLMLGKIEGRRRRGWQRMRWLDGITYWFPLGCTGWISLQSKGHSRVFPNTTVQKHQFFGTQLSLSSNSHIHTRLLEKPELWLDGPLLATGQSTGNDTL